MALRKYTELGRSEITVSRIGTGTNRWAFGENDKAVYEAYRALLDRGIDFFDTAEIYTGGRSERLLGECHRRDGRPSILASKYMPSEDRTTLASFTKALDATLDRLGVNALDLYYIHMPPATGSIETLMDFMAEAHEAGKVHAIGVSNFSAEQMRLASTQLEEHGIPLAANQVEYSLSNREPEYNGVLKACEELVVSMIAYRPLSRGILAIPQRNPPKDKVETTLKVISDKHNVAPSQVALAWLLHRDERIIPIPGATKIDHVIQNAESLKLILRNDEWKQIDEASRP